MISIRSIALLLFDMFPLVCFAQPGNARFNLNTPGIQQWFKGWYVDLDKDTVSGYIFLSNQIDNQVMFRYSNDPLGTSEQKIEAIHSNGYMVKDRVYEIMKAEPMPLFVRRVETGRLNLYTWYNIPKVGTVHDGWYDRPITNNDEKFHEVKYFLKMGESQYYALPSSKEFAESMSQVVSDFEALSHKISEKLKGYRSADILNIVQEYNQWYAVNHR